MYLCTNKFILFTLQTLLSNLKFALSKLLLFIFPMSNALESKENFQLFFIHSHFKRDKSFMNQI